MPISKKFNNTGKSGNHGMQDIDYTKRILTEDKLIEENTKLFASCSNGHTFIILGESSLKESFLLSDKIAKEHLCPFCKTIKVNGINSINFKFCVDNESSLMEISFNLNGKKINTIYKPDGYVFIPREEEE